MSVSKNQQAKDQMKCIKTLLRWQKVDEDDIWAFKSVDYFVVKLWEQEGALEELERALSSPGTQTKCVPFPRGPDFSAKVIGGLPHVVACRIWRWPNLKTIHDLISLTFCQYPYYPKVKIICINPYHHRRLVDPPVAVAPVFVPRCHGHPSTSVSSANLPVLPSSELMMMPPSIDWCLQDAACGSNQSRILTPSTINLPVVPSSMPMMMPPSSAADSLNPVSYSGNVPGPCSSLSSLSPLSISTPGFSQTQCSDENLSPLSRFNQIKLGAAGMDTETFAAPFKEPKHWSSIAYYELGSRVGKVQYYQKNIITIDGLTDPPFLPCHSSDRFSIGHLRNLTRTLVIENRRRSIGKGVQLAYVGGSVYAECLSDFAVFIQSVHLNRLNGREHDAVYQMPFGGMIEIFCGLAFAELLGENVRQGIQAVLESESPSLCTIRMSFGEGWGPGFDRPDITSTPCWIEINLLGGLQWFNKVLWEMGAKEYDISSVS